MPCSTAAEAKRDHRVFSTAKSATSITVAAPPVIASRHGPSPRLTWSPSSFTMSSLVCPYELRTPARVCIVSPTQSAPGTFSSAARVT